MSSTDGTLAARFLRLRGVNLVVGVVMLAQGVLLWVLGNDLALPVTASYLTDDPVRVQEGTPPEVLFDLPVAPLVAVFVLFAAADHLLMASPGVVRWYEERLRRRANYARWIEYSVSSSLMVVLIVMFVGIRDVAALIGVFAANSAMILFGLLMERQQDVDRPDWSAFVFGSLVGLAPWLAVIVYLAGADEVPGFVWGIVTTQFVLFFSFALNMALQYLKVGRWRDYVFGEYGYLVLSFAAKTLLAWLIYANVLRT